MSPAVKPNVIYHDLDGVSYQEAWDLQTQYHEKLKALKKAKNGEGNPVRHHLIFCEHKHVYTLGKSGSDENLLLNEDQLKDEHIEYFPINRGGDITYHGPGQITGYPILDLDEFYHDVRRYVRDLEQSIIDLLEIYGIQGERLQNYTGVWIDKGTYKAKICAIGVHMSRWVTLHGFALNVNTDLSYFGNIIPCGIVDQDKQVTSLQQELGRQLDMGVIKEQLKDTLAANFGFKIINNEIEDQ